MITTKAYFNAIVVPHNQFNEGFKTAMSMAGYIITEAGAIAEAAAKQGEEDGFPPNLTGKEAAFERYDSY